MKIMVIHIYKAPGHGQTTPWSQKVYNYKHVQLCPMNSLKANCLAMELEERECNG